MIVLREYQEKAVVELATDIERLAPHTDVDDRLVVLDAPTGAGKTVILAAALDRASQDFAVLWLTPGKGQLADQTYRALDRHLTTSLFQVRRPNETWLNSNRVVPPATVLVANWEQLTQTDKATGTAMNRVVRPGERPFGGFYEVLGATHSDGTPLVVVIDESHYGQGASGTSSVLSRISEVAPHLRIESSATPQSKVTRDGKAKDIHVEVLVDLEEVIAEGMLVHPVRTNWGIQADLQRLDEYERAAITGEKAVLDGALRQLRDLRGRYEEIGADVRPLMLVQIPDGKAGDAKLSSVEAFLEQEGIDRDSGKLAVWLSEWKTPNLDGIAAFNSNVEVLVFKTAVALGWDCPRAQVLVCFREMASDIFRVQTLGRILRTPERRHYGPRHPDHSDLDAAYVFANIDVPTGPRLQADDEFAHDDVELHPRDQTSLELPASFLNRRPGKDTYLKAGEFTDAFAKAATGLASQLPGHRPRLTDVLLSDTVVETTDVLDGDDRITPTSSDSTDTRRSESDVEADFNALLNRWVGRFTNKKRSKEALRNGLYRWFRENRPRWFAFGDGAGELAAQCAMLHHIDLIAKPMDTAIAEIGDSSTDADCTADSRDFVWRLAQVQVSAYTYEPRDDLVGCVLASTNGKPWLPKGKSSPEIQMLKWLSNAASGETPSVLWWMKNGENSRSWFSITYTRSDGTQSDFYPDFIAELDPTVAGRRRIAIFETKGDPDIDSANTPDKAKALAELAADLRSRGFDVTAGIVIPHRDHGLLLREGADYHEPGEHPLANGWKQLPI